MASKRRNLDVDISIGDHTNWFDIGLTYNGRDWSVISARSRDDLMHISDKLNAFIRENLTDEDSI